MRKAMIIVLLIILVSLAIAFYYYPKFPDKVASHWNSQGEVNGYMSKFWGLFMMPLMLIVFSILFFIIPLIDPLKKNIAKFRGYYDGFIVFISLFFLYIYLLTIFWNLGYRFNFMYAIVPAMAILFYYAGILIENAKRNWFIGIRTPWTLSSDKVWDKTHKLGGILFKISALISLIGLYFKDYAIWFLLVPVLSSTIYIIIYSYWIYRKINLRKKQNFHILMRRK